MALDAETLDRLLAAVGRFVAEVLVPAERRVAEEDRVPPEIVAGMRGLGLFGLSIPEEYGGLGLTLEEEVRVALLLGETSPAFRSVIGTNVGVGSRGIVIAGTEEQKRAYLPRIASGKLVVSLALTEPEAGSDAASLRTTARRDGGTYVLSGTKRFITNAPDAGLFTVLARTGTREEGAKGISAFLVERGAPGLGLGRPEKKMGQQGAPVSDVVFADCRVPATALLGKEGEGFRTAMRVIDRSRIHIAAVCVGVSERLIRDSLAYAMARRQFGRPIAEFQLVQAMLAESRTEAYAARSMVLETACRYDRGESVGTEAACSKLFASETAGRIADRAVQIHGGLGYMREVGIERFYRDVRLFRIYEGTSEIQKLVIARNMIRAAGGKARGDF